jgi:hypothetical protein
MPQKVWHCHAAWCTSVIPALGKWRQEVCGVKTNLGYIARTYLRKQKKLSIGANFPTCNPSYSRGRDWED